MDSKYQKYYDKLKDKNFSAYTSKYSSSISVVKTKLDTVSKNISDSSLWTEQGIKTLQGSTIPKILNMESVVEKGISSLSTAVSKCSTLVSKLASLEQACGDYNRAKEEDKQSYKSRINTLESEIDGIINEINSITVEKLQDSNSSIDSIVQTSDTIASKKAAFLGDVDDLTQYSKSSDYKNATKHLTAFDNTTGEVIIDGSTLYLKPGETRIITVKLPTDTGPIGELKRTTADGDENYKTGSYVTSQCDVDPDPNKIDYVNYQPQDNHFPNVDLHQNHYDWIITANNEGKASLKQTCEYSLKDEPNWYAEAVYDLNVVVKP